jgi:peptidoglycan/xylan/chitin deacetylase (PgdA/CDA1 family)
MKVRNQLRTLLIQAATLVRADEVALALQKRGGSSQGLVVGVHETPKSLEAQFREQLEWVSRHFTITSLEAFSKLWENPEHGANSKPPVLFTFDDGRESNYSVAAPLLESFGGRGVFFVVPAFAECQPGEALAFYRSRINPNSRPGDEKWEDWKPMNPAQIAELAARGHAIGNHTLTHQRLAGLSPENLEREIGNSARKLTTWTKRPVEAFAWTFGWDAVDANARQVIQRHHRFCFSPCAGTVDSRFDTPALLWRREVEVKYSAAEYRFLYSGLVDPWWSTRRRRLRKMLQVPSLHAKA